jgi:hypothetical protein
MDSQRVEIDEDTLLKLWENPPTLEVDPDVFTVVYLDQKAWGNLLAGSQDEDSEYRDAYRAAKRSTDELNYIYPFSISNLVETGAHPEREFRKDMYELMFELSGNHSLANFFDVERMEAAAYVYTMSANLKNIDVRRGVIGKGMVHPHGKPRIQPEDFLTEEQRDKLHRIWASDEYNELVFKSDATVDYITEDRSEQMDQYIGSLEQIREGIPSVGSSDSENERVDYISSVFGSQVLPLINRLGDQLLIDTREHVTADLLAKDRYAFLAQFPAHYTYAHLAFARDSHTDREIESGDLNDIMSLSVATPHSDVVVTEQFFGGMPYRYDIDEVFNTEIYFDSKDLSNRLSG